MLHLHRISLAAPLLLALACNGGGGNTTTSDSTSGDGSSSTSGVTPTTSDEQITTTTVDPTTGPAGSTSTTDPVTTSDSSTGTVEPGGCELTSDCADGQSCWALYDMVIDGPGPFGCERECVSDMGEGNSEEVWCADDAACCNADATCGNSGYCELAASTTGDTETTTGDTDSSGTDSSGTDSSGSSGSTGDTDTGGGLLPKISLSGLEVFADCMPIVPNDPVTAKWTALFDNKLGDADITATVVEVNLIYNPGNTEFVQDIEATPKTSGLVAVGKTVMKAMSKTKAIDDLPDDCSKCGMPVVVEVKFLVDGQMITEVTGSTLMCAF